MTLATCLLLTAVALAPSDDPPVRLRLSDDGAYRQGDHARVYLTTEEDGYVVVLRADGSGRVRVLFPLDPGDDDFVRGGREFELRGRGDRDAFVIDEREGAGIVLVAHSQDPFTFDPFVRADHWDYRTLGPVQDDPEAGLLDIVRRMAAERRFEYDVVTYTISMPIAYHSYGGWGGWYGPWGSGFHLSLAFGFPFYPYYRPFGYPYFGYPFFYGGYCCGAYWGYGGLWYGGYSRYASGPHAGATFGRPVHGGPPRFEIPRDKPLITPVEPRRRSDMRSPGSTLRRASFDVPGRERVEPGRDGGSVGREDPRRRSSEWQPQRSTDRGRTAEPRGRSFTPRDRGVSRSGGSGGRRSTAWSGRGTGRSTFGGSVARPRGGGSVGARRR